MPGTNRVTALARLDRRGVIDLSCHRAIAATEKTAASHPDRHADRQQQPNHFVREKQPHLAGSLRLRALFVEV